MKISKVVGNVSYLMSNCDITFYKKSFEYNPIGGSSLRNGWLAQYNFGNFEEIVEEITIDNILLELPFKTEYTSEINHRKQYKNNYLNREKFLFNSSNNVIIKMLSELYSIEISEVNIEYDYKKINNKTINMPKNIKVYCNEDVKIVRRKINLKKLDI